MNDADTRDRGAQGWKAKGLEKTSQGVRTQTPPGAWLARGEDSASKKIGKSEKHSDNNDAGGVGAEDLGCSGKGERHIEASRERALKASLRSLDLSVDKRELIKGL